MVPALFAAPLLALAQPIEVAPPTALPEGVAESARSGGAALELLVDPNGAVVECRELAHFGDTRLAAKACALEWTGRWEAARGADGKPAYGLVRTSRLMGPDRPAVVPEPDLELEVEGMAAGRGRRAVDVIVAVDAKGRATQCAPTPAADMGLAVAACADLERLAVRKVAVPGGDGVAYVTVRTVRFVPAS